MQDESVIRRVRSVGTRMGQTMDRFAFGSNHTAIAAEMNALADEATEASGYHDHIFQTCNVIRSHVSHFHRVRKHKAAVREIRGPIGRLEHWAPDEAAHPAA